MAKVKFDLKTSNENTVYGIELTGFPKKTVRYTQKTDDGTKSYDIEWEERYNKNIIKAMAGGDADLKLSFAKNVGFERVKYVDKADGKEKERVLRKDLTEYDAAIEMIEKKRNGFICDGSSLYVSGKVVPNSWIDTDGSVRRAVRLHPDTINLTTVPIDLDGLDDDAKRKSATFNSEIIVKKFYELDGNTYMTGILVGYDYIEEMEFEFVRPGIAETFKQTLKPYNMIKCFGIIKQEVKEENINENKESTCWGNMEDYSTKRTGKTKMVWKIGAADPSTIDTDSYSEEKVEKAKRALKAWKEDYKAGKEKEEIEQVNNSFDDFGSAEDFGDEFD